MFRWLRQWLLSIFKRYSYYAWRVFAENFMAMQPFFFQVTHACIAAEKLKLPAWVEPFAVGLFDVLLDFPYDIMGIKVG